MGLSESKKEDLEAKDFHLLFKKHRPKWAAIAEKAYAYAQENITEGREPRGDDVADALLPILNADTDLKAHQRANKANAKRYREMFAEYIVDQILTRGKLEKKK